MSSRSPGQVRILDARGQLIAVVDPITRTRRNLDGTTDQIDGSQPLPPKPWTWGRWGMVKHWPKGNLTILAESMTGRPNPFAVGR